VYRCPCSRARGLGSALNAGRRASAPAPRPDVEVRWYKKGWPSSLRATNLCSHIPQAANGQAGRLTHPLERRWSSRRFPYGYLVTT